jgi:hypothetical protein
MCAAEGFRRERVGWVFALLLFAAGPHGLQAAEPLALHPDNPHYFLWRGEPTVLVTSAEHYGALLNLDFDYARYLKALQKDGMNHTRTFSGVYRELPSSFGITDNPLAPKPHRYVCPWARSETPGYADGGNRFDLQRWDPAYFQRLKDFLKHADRCGVVVELTLFCPMYRQELWDACPMNAANNVNGIGKCSKDEVYTLQQPDLLAVQLAVARKIVEETQEFDNLYYEVCNEPYFGGVTVPWQHRIVDEIVRVEAALPRQHLISMNIANGSCRVESPHPRVSIFNFHYCTPPEAVGQNYDLNREIGENETGFRGKDDVLYRTEAWDFLIAGGGLYNNLDYSFTVQHPTGTFLDYRSPGGGSPALRGQLRTLKAFLEGFPLVQMAPDDQVLRSVNDPLVVRALSQPGRAYAIYVHVPIAKKPKPEQLQQLGSQSTRAELVLELPPGDYHAEWLNTITGQVVGTADLAVGKRPVPLASPAFQVDLALRILRE